VYVCDIKDANNLSYTSDVYGEPSVFSKTPQSFFEETLPTSVTYIFNQTQGWFSKALTEEWLIEKLTYSIPTELVQKGFDGSVVYTPVRLHISKDSFVIEFTLTDTKENEKVCIEFNEEVPIVLSSESSVPSESSAPSKSSVPSESSAPSKSSAPSAPASVPAIPTNTSVFLPTDTSSEGIRHEMKKKVLQARERAARALFKAEELMHSYVEIYGTDTDWEDRDEDE